ncbi:PITH domain-containing protein 1 [Rhizophlyctis rosea]|nr:PITH domain-containing protein 1 [Rhizophlyctis rosea]
MSNCCSHAHPHDHGGDDHHHHHGHDHDHDHDGPDRGREFTLYQQVDIDRVRCLNESENGAAKTVFKSWEEREDRTQFVESDADEQLIIHVPFTANVKLKSIAIIADHSDQAPSKLKAFVNRDDIDFDTADSTEATQEWDLVDPQHIPLGSLPEYPTRIAKFSNLRSVTLYFPENFGGETTTIFYIGLKGEWMEINKDPIITIYELA